MVTQFKLKDEVKTIASPETTTAVQNIPQTDVLSPEQVAQQPESLTSGTEPKPEPAKTEESIQKVETVAQGTETQTIQVNAAAPQSELSETGQSDQKPETAMTGTETQHEASEPQAQPTQKNEAIATLPLKISQKLLCLLNKLREIKQRPL